MSYLKTASKFLLAIFMVGAGTTHCVSPEFYITIMPPYLPWHLPLVYLSGFFEVALGLLMLVPRFSRLAAWGIIALLIAVFPANIYMAVAPDRMPEMHISRWALWLRLPFQIVFIVWIWFVALWRESEKTEIPDNKNI